MDVLICDAIITTNKGNEVVTNDFMIREDAIKDPVAVQQRANALLSRKQYCSSIRVTPRKTIGIESRPVSGLFYEYVYEENAGLKEEVKKETLTAEEQIQKALNFFNDEF